MKEFNQAQALREGWCISNDNELQRSDEAGIFSSDAAAVCYVLAMANRGWRYHADALKRVSPEWLTKLSRE